MLLSRRSQHTGSHRNSLNLLGEKYFNESHWPMRRIRLLECMCRFPLCFLVDFKNSVNRNLTTKFRNKMVSLVVLVKNSNYLENSLITLGLIIGVKKLPSVHVLGDFSFKDIDWPEYLDQNLNFKKRNVRKQHDLYENNLVGDVKANPRDFYRYINSQKKDTQGIPPLKRKNGEGVA